MNIDLVEIEEATLLLENSRHNEIAENLLSNYKGVFKLVSTLVNLSHKTKLYEGLAISCFKLGVYLGYQQAQLDNIEKKS